MKRFIFPLVLGAVALLAPGRSLAQDKPVLNTAPPGSAVPATPAPAQPAAPVYTPAPTPAAPVYPPAPATEAQPSYNSPSGLELPGREQARKEAQQHAEQFTKFFIYSGFGLNYGSNYYTDGGALNVSVSPALGYRINDRIAVGPGFSYAYTNQTFGTGNPTLNLNSVGVKAFAQVQIINQFFAHAEYEVTSAELPIVDVNNNYRVVNNQILTGKRTVRSPLAGAGYRSQFSNRVAADILLLYNFNDSFNESIYRNPVIRFNFLFNIGK